MFIGKPEMDTWDGSWRKSVRGGDIGVWKEEATKDTYIVVVGMAKKKGVVFGLALEGRMLSKKVAL